VTNQLTAADHTSQPDENYSFDLNGNRTMAGHTVIANNRLSTDGVYNYAYDNEGNLLSRTNISDSTSEEYAWDHRNRLVKVTFKDSMGATTKTVEHAYDVYNRWVRRTVDLDGPGGSDPTDTIFAYDGYNPVLQFDGSSADDIDHRYLFGPAVDQILADQDVNNASSAGNTLWGLADHLGTPRDVADLNEGTGTTAVTNHRTYNSFGTQISETNAAVDFLLARRQDARKEHTGMNNHLHRWLRGGWWVNEDPIGFGAVTQTCGGMWKTTLLRL
jgi:YD repeat-containing protein